MVSMTRPIATSLNGSRIAQWTAAAALLLFPLVMMQVGREWHWGIALIAGIVIGGALLLIELVVRTSADPAYRTGVTTALGASFLLTWVNLVAGITGNQDSPVNFGFFILVLTAGVSAFAVRARPDGMARAMLGVAVVQAILTALAATDPSTASDPRGVGGVVLLSGYFTALWLISAALFHRSARMGF
jgi:hypothetical protein